MSSEIEVGGLFRPNNSLDQVIKSVMRDKGMGLFERMWMMFKLRAIPEDRRKQLEKELTSKLEADVEAGIVNMPVNAKVQGGVLVSSWQDLFQWFLDNWPAILEMIMAIISLFADTSKLISWIVLAISLSFASSAIGQITVPEEVKRDKMVECTLDQDVPDGAYLADGGWEVLPAEASNEVDTRDFGKMLLFTGPPGLYSVVYDGVILKDVSFTVDGQAVTVTSYLGRIKGRKNCRVLGGDDPNPPGPGPGPGTKWNIVLFYHLDQLDNLPQEQRTLLKGLKVRQDLKSLGHALTEVVEWSSLSSNGVPDRLASFAGAVEGDPLPRVAIQSQQGGNVLDYPLPVDYARLVELLKNPPPVN